MKKGRVVAVICFLLWLPAFTQAREVLLGTTQSPLQYTGTEIRVAVSEINYDYKLATPIVVGDNVESYVNLGPSVDVPLETVLDLICAPSGLEWVKTDDFYLVLYPDPDNPVFQRYAVKHWVRLNYIGADTMMKMLNSSAQYAEADAVNDRILLTALEGPMMDRIEGIIKKVDVEVLKQVEIRLVTLEYSIQAKEEISLESLEAFIGDAVEQNQVNSVTINEHVFGAVNKDMVSLVRLKVLSTKDEMRITGDQKIILREGQEAKLNLDKKGDIFLESVTNTGYSRIEKTSVQAGQGVQVEVLKVTSNGEVMLHVEGRLEDIQQAPEVIQAGQSIWTESALLDSNLKMENNRTIEIGKLSRKYSRETSGIASKISDKRDKEVLFLLTVHIVETGEAQPLSVEEGINAFFAENRSTGGPYRLTVGVGAWIQEEEEFEAEPIGEAQLRLWKQLRVFGGGGENLAYGGAKYGDIIRLGAGGMTSDNLSSVEPFVSAGISIGNDRIRLEADYLYPPYVPEESGVIIKLCVGLFGGRKPPPPPIPEPIVTTRDRVVKETEIEEVEVDIIIPEIDPDEWYRAIDKIGK